MGAEIPAVGRERVIAVDDKRGRLTTSKLASVLLDLASGFTTRNRKSFAVVERIRTVGGKRNVKRRHYINGPAAHMDKVARAVHIHWDRFVIGRMHCSSNTGVEEQRCTGSVATARRCLEQSSWWRNARC